ncbi:DUF305 domain-containing protein [Myceligenerans pegani]|uniref:DUF305 domain-containing protein n=1 Tax=Myceligenerans pegani TaxID=2776917 RepID=A0ABR9MY23_9MICO|nr:DUF305 domain-containing protein [Myceligenerans sp. TRM 65318]MBE1876274.1 DUF305 domain-containing protein [Myceligenerans sp. TRM 65318]MBE3018545.1 DUF305 domain-containing protein [Myceligenerans sp. TRM 65318]
MKHTLISVVALAGALALAGCSGPEEPAQDTASTAGEHTEHNDADVMFAQMMIPHHEQAIEMADIVLAEPGADPRIAELATRVKEAQAPEIEELGRWLDTWGAERTSEHSGHAGMDGMMSEEDMQMLDDAAGPEANRLFLEQMIVHHQGAIEMARTEIESGQDAGAVEMAQTIIDTQDAEIETMEELLASM